MIKNNWYPLSNQSLIIATQLSVLLLFVMTSLSAQILKNPDFESQEEAKDAGTAWVIGTKKLPISLGKGADGKGKSLELHSDSSNGSHFFQFASLNPQSLCQYELSFKLKTKGLKGSSAGIAWINLFDGDSTMILENVWGGYQGLKQWTSYSYTFFVPSNTEMLKVGGSITGKGTLWFDDFELKKVDFNTEEITLSPSADQFISSVVDTMRTYALYKDKINFDDIHQIIRYYANGAEKPEDTYKAIKSGVHYLIDNHHSNFFTPEELKQYFGDMNVQELFEQKGYIKKEGLNMDSLKSTINFSSGKLIHQDIGYISLVSFTHLYLDVVTLYADSVQKLIRQLDQSELKGWVVDLRGNTGGATPPMVVGIGPLLQESNKAYYMDAAHHIESAFSYYNGGYHEKTDDDTGTYLSLASEIDYKVKNNTLPIAVLIDRQTASAAEGVATLLAGEPNVKMFGEKTAGLTTGNSLYAFPDNAALNMATSYLANQDLDVYEKGIAPDVPVESGNREEASEDVVLQKALEWLNSQ